MTATVISYSCKSLDFWRRQVQRDGCLRDCRAPLLWVLWRNEGQEVKKRFKQVRQAVPHVPARFVPPPLASCRDRRVCACICFRPSKFGAMVKRQAQHRTYYLSAEWRSLTPPFRSFARGCSGWSDLEALTAVPALAFTQEKATEPRRRKCLLIVYAGAALDEMCPSGTPDADY